MQTSNYAQVRDALYNRESFQHGSCYGTRLEFLRGYYGLPRVYEVYSYSTLILTYDLDAHVVTYFDYRPYSNTTSRLQNMIRDQYGLGGTLYDSRVVYDWDCTLDSARTGATYPLAVLD